MKRTTQDTIIVQLSMLKTMLKTALKYFLSILLVLIILYAVGRFVVVYQDSRLIGNRAPYIQMLTTNSVIIHWLTAEEQATIVRYGEDKSQLDMRLVDDALVKNHIARLSNLKPGTKYYYQIEPYQIEPIDVASVNAATINAVQAQDSDKQWFYTHPQDDVSTRIWVIGDSGEFGETLNQVRDSALNWMRENPKLKLNDSEIDADVPLVDVWLSLGDIAYRSGTNEQYQASLFDTFADLTANTVLWPVYGNHDERRWTYFRIFDLPENAEAGGLASNTENYYAFDYSNVHFVMLDSQDSDRSANGEMALWLKKDLAQNTRPWTIAVLHHPPYTKGTHDSDSFYDSRGRMVRMRENILPILEQGGVDLVMSGHSHMYERSYLLDCAYGQSDSFSQNNIVSAGVNGKHQRYIKPLQKKNNQGAIYIVAGSASKVDQGAMNHPAHHVGLLEAGSMIIDIDENKLIARFINNYGEIKDSFSITKQDGYYSDYRGCE